jgi:hypothetical protein
VTFGVGTAAAIGGSDNAGERELVRRLVLELAALAESTDTQGVEETVEAVAPRGPKKMLMAVPFGANPVFEEDVPRARLVDEADIGVHLDALGEWLAARAEVGRIAEDQTNAILNGAVAFYFERLESLVATLTPEGLLEFLIEQNEALLREQAETQLLLPTRVACFWDEATVTEQLKQELPLITKTSVANRFLVEYVAARPPEGQQRIDRLLYDELLALAAEIADKGFLSDCVHFDLSRPRLVLLPSVRLGIGGPDPIRAAMDAYGSVQAADTLATAQLVFASHWEELASEPPDFVAALERAFVDEFAVSVTEMAELLDTLDGLTHTQEREPRVLAQANVTKEIANSLGWDEPRVEQMLSLLILEPREQFIPPGEARDVYPWRFGRRLSFLRRPLVRRRAEAREHELLWGTRSLRQAGPYLVDLCMSGRLQAVSASMQSLVTQVRQTEAARFNDLVSEAVGGMTRLVRVRVKKVGDLRICRANGEELGDIDVLVINIRAKRITAIEAKDFELARTPVEWRHELDKLFVGPESAILHHGERVEWLRRNWQTVLDWMEVERGKPSWHVGGLVVTSRELVTPLAQRAPMPVVPLSRLAAAPDKYM